MQGGRCCVEIIVQKISRILSGRMSGRSEHLPGIVWKIVWNFVWNSRQSSRQSSRHLPDIFQTSSRQIPDIARLGWSSLPRQVELGGQSVMSSGKMIKRQKMFCFGFIPTNTVATRAPTLENRCFSSRFAQSGLTEIEPGFREKNEIFKIRPKYH